RGAPAAEEAADLAQREGGDQGAHARGTLRQLPGSGGVLVHGGRGRRGPGEGTGAQAGPGTAAPARVAVRGHRGCHGHPRHADHSRVARGPGALCTRRGGRGGRGRRGRPVDGRRAPARRPGGDPPEVPEEEIPAPSADEITPTPEPVAPIERIDPATGRLERLRGRLARSQNTVGQGLLGLLGAGDLDEDAGEEIEDTLIMADLGAPMTEQVVNRLREDIATKQVRTEGEVRDLLRQALIDNLHPEYD